MFKVVVLCYVLGAAHYAAGQLHGTVVKIADGDTFTILIDQKQKRVRLYGIDCPERNQDFGLAAKKFTTSCVAGKKVLVVQKHKDRNGRIVGVVFVDGFNLNEALLREGYAWQFTRYDNSPEWTALQDAARKQRKGLWQQPSPIPPWEFRARRRK